MTDSKNSSMNVVSLKVGNEAFSGWQEITISSGIDRLARSFSVNITREWAENPECLPIEEGSLVEVFIGDDLIVTGYIDSMPIQYDSDAITLSISGRSKTADCIDCSAIPCQFIQSTATHIISELIEPYGLTVINPYDDQNLLNIQVDMGETLFDSICKVINQQQILIYDDEQGNVVIGQIGDKQADTALELGKNILSASTERDYQACYSQYYVYGQRNDDNVDNLSGNVAAVKDIDDGSRYRLLIIKQSGDVTTEGCEIRVNQEALYRRSQTKLTTYIVQGWRQNSGALWQSNMRVIVNDPLMGFDQQELIIAEVTYKLGSSGMTCELKVGPKEAYLSLSQ